MQLALSAAGDAFSRRLDPVSALPVAMAFSGGPDSYLALRRSVAATGRRVIALHIDHGLNPRSGAWAEKAEALARDLGADFRVLRWEGRKPARGIPAAARAARHRLLADGARASGAKVIVTGHTADDALENAALGQGRLSEWSPSPVWPEGRGLMLLRPLLRERRAAIRARLAEEGVLSDLVDDPANADRSHPRIAVRQALAGADEPLELIADQTPFPFEILPGEGVRLSRNVLGPRALALAMTVVGGGERLPRKAEVERLLKPGAGTLVGAKLVTAGDEVLIVRNAGEAARSGLRPLHLEPQQTGVFDGRFEITAGASPVDIALLKGLSRRLPDIERRVLCAIPAALRPALPAALSGNYLSCPILAESSAVRLRGLVAARLAQACGAIAHEAAL